MDPTSCSSSRICHASVHTSALSDRGNPDRAYERLANLLDNLSAIYPSSSTISQLHRPFPMTLHRPEYTTQLCIIGSVYSQFPFPVTILNIKS
uniref:Putative matrix protein n=1 Tax=Soybean cyst nematode nyami-like virus TaxID=2107712 RepID=A0A2P1CXV6_9MONO|nr:putative matrix protein [Soybean cyst nematode nyami-like virus]AVK42868.1 putative matrix protein [Soybean cyst nematode nyami-like virus]AVK42873.1 putative matrix protein [Soybean cyst nematode nyami-like virus]